MRRARLAHRGLLDAAPRLLVRAGVAAAALTIVTLVVGALLADASGRSFPYRAGPYTADASPFPGLFYGLPAGLGLSRSPRSPPPSSGSSRTGLPWPRRTNGSRRRLRGRRRTASSGSPSVCRCSSAAACSRRRQRAEIGGLEHRRLPARRSRSAPRTAILGFVAMLAGVVVGCLPAPRCPPTPRPYRFPDVSLDISVDVKSPTPPYEQIRSQIAAYVQSGLLPDGARLPTMRALAADLGVATGTVARAYSELEAAGLIASRRRTGTVVIGPGPRAAEEADVRRGRGRAGRPRPRGGPRRRDGARHRPGRPGRRRRTRLSRGRS